jgi:hypothetical protein
MANTYISSRIRITDLVGVESTHLHRSLYSPSTTEKLSRYLKEPLIDHAPQVCPTVERRKLQIGPMHVSQVRPLLAQNVEEQKLTSECSRTAALSRQHSTTVSLTNYLLLTTHDLLLGWHLTRKR